MTQLDPDLLGKFYSINISRKKNSFRHGWLILNHETGIIEFWINMHGYDKFKNSTDIDFIKGSEKNKLYRSLLPNGIIRLAQEFPKGHAMFHLQFFRLDTKEEFIEFNIADSSLGRSLSLNPNCVPRQREIERNFLQDVSTFSGKCHAEYYSNYPFVQSASLDKSSLEFHAYIYMFDVLVKDENLRMSINPETQHIYILDETKGDTIKYNYTLGQVTMSEVHHPPRIFWTITHKSTTLTIQFISRRHMEIFRLITDVLRGTTIRNLVTLLGPMEKDPVLFHYKPGSEPESNSPDIWGSTDVNFDKLSNSPSKPQNLSEKNSFRKISEQAFSIFSRKVDEACPPNPPNGPN
jgi:hypothetical protein